MNDQALADYVQSIVDEAPPLDADEVMRQRIAGLLRPSTERTTAERLPAA